MVLFVFPQIFVFIPLLITSKKSTKKHPADSSIVTMQLG